MELKSELQASAAHLPHLWAETDFIIPGLASVPAKSYIVMPTMYHIVRPYTDEDLADCCSESCAVLALYAGSAGETSVISVRWVLVGNERSALLSHYCWLSVCM